MIYFFVKFLSITIISMFLLIIFIFNFIFIAKGDPRDEEVWFHFKEGYSNAVRKTVYIKDLL